MLNKHPGSLLDAADIVRVGRGQRGIFKFAIERDCELLLFSFIKQSSHDYDDFMRVWNQLKFYHVHFAGIMKEDRPEFMQGFYNVFMEHFRSDLELMRIGVIYALYFMYYSQPTLWERCGIRVEQDVWQHMHAFYVAGAKRKSSKEHARATLAFDRLVKDSAFVFVVQVDVAIVNPFEIEELQPANELLNMIKGVKRRRMEHDVVSVCSQQQQQKALSDAYQKAKSLVLEAPQALLTAQTHLKRKTTVTEHNERLLRNALQGSTLAGKEADFQQTLDTAATALWQSRYARLEHLPKVFNESKRKRYTRRPPTTTTTTTTASTKGSDVRPSIEASSSTKSPSPSPSPSSPSSTLDHRTDQAPPSIVTP